MARSPVWDAELEDSLDFDYSDDARNRGMGDEMTAKEKSNYTILDFKDDGVEYSFVSETDRDENWQGKNLANGRISRDYVFTGGFDNAEIPNDFGIRETEKNETNGGICLDFDETNGREEERREYLRVYPATGELDGGDRFNGVEEEYGNVDEVSDRGEIDIDIRTSLESNQTTTREERERETDPNVERESTERFRFEIEVPVENDATTTGLKRAIDVVEENLTQLKVIYEQKGAENARQAHEAVSVKQDHDTKNGLKKEILRKEQELVTAQNDLKVAQDHIEMLNNRNASVIEQLSSEREINLQSIRRIVDQLSLVSNVSGGTIDPQQQMTWKSDIESLVKMLGVEELRSSGCVRSPTSSPSNLTKSEPFFQNLTSNSPCLKPVNDGTSTTSKSQSIVVDLRPQRTDLISHTPNGITRCRSAPVKSSNRTNSCAIYSLKGLGLGQGTDYFQYLKNERQRTSLSFENNIVKDRQRTMTSSTNDLHIIDIQPDGKFIRIANASNTIHAELGNHTLQQNIEGHPVAVFHFPSRVHCPVLSTITVWSEGCDSALHRPPTNFVFRGQQKWKTGPRTSTILCRSNGQAVAWHTALAKPSASYDDQVVNDAREKTLIRQHQDTVSLSPSTPNSTSYINRKVLSHEPHPPPPATDQMPYVPSPNSHRNNVIPGLPFAGAPGQRLGSASLRRFQSNVHSCS